MEKNAKIAKIINVKSKMNLLKLKLRLIKIVVNDLQTQFLIETRKHTHTLTHTLKPKKSKYATDYAAIQALIGMHINLFDRKSKSD